MISVESHWLLGDLLGLVDCCEVDHGEALCLLNAMGSQGELVVTCTCTDHLQQQEAKYLVCYQQEQLLLHHCLPLA